MADPGIFDWGRGPSFGLERTVELFVANYFSRRQPRVSQSVNAGRRWRGKYCFASGGEQIRGLMGGGGGGGGGGVRTHPQ